MYLRIIKTFLYCFIVIQDPIQVVLDPPADLDVDVFTVPVYVESTETIDILWTIKNIGFMTPYETFWRDLVVRATWSIY